MRCINETCEWFGELSTHRIAMVGAIAHCGLCMQPASAESAPAKKLEAPPAPVVRRDFDAENQRALADTAEVEFKDLEAIEQDEG